MLQARVKNISQQLMFYSMKFNIIITWPCRSWSEDKPLLALPRYAPYYTLWVHRISSIAKERPQQCSIHAITHTHIPAASPKSIEPHSNSIILPATWELLAHTRCLTGGVSVLFRELAFRLHSSTSRGLWFYVQCSMHTKTRESSSVTSR